MVGKIIQIIIDNDLENLLSNFQNLQQYYQEKFNTYLTYKNIELQKKE